MILVPRPPRKGERRRRALVLLLSAVLAVGVQLALLGLVVLSSVLKWDVPPRPAPPPSNKPVTLRGLSNEAFEQNRGPDAQRVNDQRQAVAKRAEKKKDPAKPPGQVVDVAPGNNQVDDKAKYAAETDNKVAKETKAKVQSPDYRNAAPQRTSTQRIDSEGVNDVNDISIAGNNGRGNDDRPLKEAELEKLAMKVPDVKPRQEIAMRTPTHEGPGVAVENREQQDAMRGNSDRWSLSPGAVNQGEDVSAGHIGLPGRPNLLPSSAVLDKLSGAAPNDFLKDVDEGDGTYLNTRQWKYAGFFNRVKQSINQHWRPADQLRLRDPSGQIYGGRDRYTVLNITLDQHGRLKETFVEKSSGIDFLDLEAMKAFERAQPFPNPPPGLLADDSTVRFQFGFMLELGGRPGLRLFRSGQ